MKKRRRLWAFVKALFHHWGVLLFSLLGLISTALFYLPFQVPRFLPDALAVGLVFIVILVASFYVYCDQAQALESLQSESGSLEERMQVESSALEKRLELSEQLAMRFQTELGKEQHAKNSLASEVQRLRDEVATLSVKPYDEQKLKYVRLKVDSLRYYERDILRFLLINGDSRADVIFFAAKSAPGGFNLEELSRALLEGNLASRRDDHIVGFSTFSLNKDFRDVLEDLLFPRKEEKPSFFTGMG